MFVPLHMSGIINRSSSADAISWNYSTWKLPESFIELSRSFTNRNSDFSRLKFYWDHIWQMDRCRPVGLSSKWSSFTHYNLARYHLLHLIPKTRTDIVAERDRCSKVIHQNWRWRNKEWVRLYRLFYWMQPESTFERKATGIEAQGQLKRGCQY